MRRLSHAEGKKVQRESKRRIAGRTLLRSDVAVLRGSQWELSLLGTGCSDLERANLASLLNACLCAIAIRQLPEGSKRWKVLRLATKCRWLEPTTAMTAKVAP